METTPISQRRKSILIGETTIIPSENANLGKRNEDIIHEGTISSPERTIVTPSRQTTGASTLRTSPQNNGTAPKTLDELLEAKMVADILRANNNLKQFKNFRNTSEKYYQDKHSDEMRRKEIREPLENAQIEIQLLKGKVTRRDEVIRSLRRYILVDSLKYGDRGDSNGQDFTKNEEFKELQVSDENAALMKIIKTHEREIMKLKAIIQQQQINIKELNDEIQKKDFLQQEMIRKYEHEREHHQSMIEKRDQRINRLCNDLETLQREKKELEEDYDQKIREIDIAEEKIKELLAQRENVHNMKEEYEERIDDLKIEIREQKEEKIVIHEKLVDLQSRYDHLVTELDSMVADGYRHTDAPPMMLSPTATAGLMMEGLQDMLNDDGTLNGGTVVSGRKGKKMKGEKRSSNAKGKGAPVHTAMKKHRETTQSIPIPDTLQEDSYGSLETIETQRSGAVNQSNPNATPSTITMMNAEIRKSQLTSPPPLHGSQFLSPRNTGLSVNPTLSTNPSSMNIANHPSGMTGMLVSPGMSKSPSVLGDSGIPGDPTNNSGGTFFPENRRESQGKFWQRKLEEDAILHEKIVANAAVRMKDQLQQQIEELEEKLKDEKLHRLKDQEALIWKEKGMRLKEQVFCSEIARLHREIALVQNAYVKLKFEARNAKIAFYHAKKTISELQTPAESRLQTARDKQNRTDSLDFPVASGLPNPQLPPDGAGGFEEYNESGVFFDDENADAGNEFAQGSQYSVRSGVSQGSRKQTGGSKHSSSRHTSAQPSLMMEGGGASREGSSIDYLGMIGANGGDPSGSFSEPVDALISIDTEWNKGIQCILQEDSEGQNIRLSSLEHQEQLKLQNQSIQFNVKDIPSEMNWKTDSQIVEEEILKNKEQLIQQEKQLNDYLIDFYENLQLILYEFFPKQKFNILNFNYDSSQSKELWMNQLQELDLLSSLDMSWQVKQTLILLVTFNELRNQFVEQLFSIQAVRKEKKHQQPQQHHQQQNHHQQYHLQNPLLSMLNSSSIESNESIFEEQLVVTFQIQCTMIIHIIDIMIQSIHHLLSPIYHLQRSEYPDLQKVFLIIRQKEAKYQISTIPFTGGNSLDIKKQQEVIATYHHSKDIFPLTQANLTTDLGYGLRKGSLGHSILTNSQSSPNKKKSYMPGYMNRSTSPRRLPAYIDQLLDRIEGRNASRSPSPVREMNQPKPPFSPEKEVMINKTNPGRVSPQTIPKESDLAPITPTTSPTKINIPTGSRPFSASSGHPKSRFPQQKRSPQPLSDFSLQEHPLMTASMSDSYLNLSQSPPPGDQLNDSDEDREELKKAVRFTIKPVTESLYPIQVNTKTTSAMTKPYSHYYFSAKHGKVTTGQGLKSLLSTKYQHLSDNSQQPEPNYPADEGKIEVHPIIPPTQITSQQDEQYLDYIRIPFNADAIESNPYGGKTQQKLQKTSARVNQNPLPTHITIDMKHISVNTVFDTPSLLMNQSYHDSSGRLQPTIKPLVQELDEITQNSAVTVANNPSIQKEIWKPPGEGVTIMSTLNEGSNSLYDKSSSILLMSEVPTIHPQTHPPQVMQHLGQKPFPNTSLTSIDDYSTNPSMNGFRITSGITNIGISSRLKETEGGPPSSANNNPSNPVPYKPQVPLKSRPTSATQQAAISRTQKNINFNATNTKALNAKPQIPPAGNQPQTATNSTARYYMPTIQAPLFPSNSSEEPEKLKIITREVPPMTDTTSPRSSSFTPKATPPKPGSFDGLAIAGLRANTSNNNREKVTNALLYM